MPLGITRYLLNRASPLPCRRSAVLSRKSARYFHSPSADSRLSSVLPTRSYSNSCRQKVLGIGIGDEADDPLHLIFGVCRANPCRKTLPHYSSARAAFRSRGAARSAGSARDGKIWRHVPGRATRQTATTGRPVSSASSSKAPTRRRPHQETEPPSPERRTTRPGEDRREAPDRKASTPPRPETTARGRPHPPSQAECPHSFSPYRVLSWLSYDRSFAGGFRPASCFRQPDRQRCVGALRLLPGPRQ